MNYFNQAFLILQLQLPPKHKLKITTVDSTWSSRQCLLRH